MKTTDFLDTRSVPNWYIASTVLTCVALFVSACMLPATSIGPSRFPAFDDGTELGFNHLLLGWLPDPRLFPHWSANPLTAIALAFFVYRRFRKAMMCGFIASLCAFTTLFTFKHDDFYVGYYLWLFCPMLLTTSAAIPERFGAAFVGVWGARRRVV